jgi:hypothetical protein
LWFFIGPWSLFQEESTKSDQGDTPLCREGYGMDIFGAPSTPIHLPVVSLFADLLPLHIVAIHVLIISGNSVRASFHYYYRAQKMSV